MGTEDWSVLMGRWMQSNTAMEPPDTAGYCFIEFPVGSIKFVFFKWI